MENPMSTREKILVGLMIAAVCLGALMLFSDGPRPTAPKAGSDDPNTLTRMLTNLAAQFGNDTSLEENRYTLAMARTPWQDTLFLEDNGLLLSSAEPPGSGDTLPSNVALIYSGYIETTQRRVAIINGIEYVEGDQLDKSIYTVRQITPGQVTLGSPQQRVFSIPLIDNWEAQTP
jgi:hypothetical protein